MFSSVIGNAKSRDTTARLCFPFSEDTYVCRRGLDIED